MSSVPASPKSLPTPELLLISDRQQAVLPLLEIAERFFEAGGRWFLLRDKDLHPHLRMQLAQALCDMARPYEGAWVSVSADLALAHETQMAFGGPGRARVGLHLQEASDVAKARRRLGPDALIGLSCHSAAELAAASDSEADYVTLSPLFLTQSKPGYGPALEVAGFAELIADIPLPALALGGITPASLPQALSAGAAGVAVMGEIMRAEDPAAVTSDLLAALQVQ
ncbi:thiamine phosphate synthase [Rhodovibrionaceae bacterium A322]